MNCLQVHFNLIVNSIAVSSLLIYTNKTFLTNFCVYPYRFQTLTGHNAHFLCKEAHKYIHFFRCL